MTSATKHFDVVGLLTAVHQQDYGFTISTNNPAGFKRIMYEQMNLHPHLKAHIYADAKSQQRFHILRAPHAALGPDIDLETEHA